jgi:hypothetical protein
MLRLQQQQMLLRSKLDRVYEDRLSDAIPEELWNSKSAALQDELRRVRTEMGRHEVASQAYETAGLQILELAQTAYSSYVAKNPHEQARLIKTLVSNSAFDRGSLSPTYVLAHRAGRFSQLADPRGSVNGLLLRGSPRFREVSLEERRSLCRLKAVCGR